MITLICCLSELALVSLRFTRARARTRQEWKLQFFVLLVARCRLPNESCDAGRVERIILKVVLSIWEIVSVKLMLGATEEGAKLL